MKYCWRIKSTRGSDILEKIELTRKEWEDFRAYVEFKGKKKKPCHSCPMCSSCLKVGFPKDRCEALRDWISESDELYSKVSRFIDSPELAAIARVMLDRIQKEESIKYLTTLVDKAKSERFKLLQSETSLLYERIAFKD